MPYLEEIVDAPGLKAHLQLRNLLNVKDMWKNQMEGDTYRQWNDLEWWIRRSFGEDL
jgi:hypothetical protein